MQSRARAVILATCLLTAVACVAYPLYVIRPFRAQGPSELAAALAIIQIRPLLLAACVLLAAGAALLDWRSTTRRARRFVTVTALLLVCASAGLSRVNVFERMFHPIDAPAFDPAPAARLETSDMVLAVSVGGADRAYPVRALAYHHIVNDTVGGVPLVGTY